MRRLAVLACSLIACAQAHDAPKARVEPAPAPPPPMESAALDAELAASLAVAKPPRTRKVVLHVGDSMVGYGHGLSRALKHRFDAMGIEYHWEAWTSANIMTVDPAEKKHSGDRDRSERLDRLIAMFHPDLVIMNLGTNNLAIPRASAFAEGIHTIAAHLAEGGRDCLWVGPLRPKWTYNPDMFDVLAQNAAPCQYFDSSAIHPPLQSDDIHPTDAGGEQWADAVWARLGEAPID
ncbi:MAG TPA: SGNH/GDSL hydrolase family protein [Polyangiaceae bacterium]|jgi:lysophospholipase L1-like esterase